MQSLYVLDALNFLFRSYYAIGQMTNPQGVPTNALYGFIRSIYKIINDFSPDYLVVVFDGPDNKKSRTDIYEAYKGHRAKMPEDLFPQLEQALYFCSIAGLPHLSIPGVEADDVIGSIAQWAKQQNIDTFICSSDKDLCQLVDQHVRLIHLHKNNLLIDRDQVLKLFGIWPEQMIDYLAIVGDASDNIPGLAGFGPKTAVQLLTEYGTLDQILNHPEALSGKKKETLINGAEIALLSRQLATIQLNVEIPKTTPFYDIKTPELPALQHFYQEMHFLSLLKELNGNKKEVQAPPDLKTTSYQLIDDLESLTQLIDLLSHAQSICIDTETTQLKPMGAHLVGIGISTEPFIAYYIPMNGQMGKTAALHALKPLLENPNIAYIGHHIKYDLHILANEGIFIKNIGFDTLIASYLINPHVQRHNLDQLCLTHFNHTKIPIEELLGKGKTTTTMDLAPIEKVCSYCCEDVDYTIRLKLHFEKQLQQEGLSSLFHQIELPLIFILLRMEREGIYIDIPHLEKMSVQITQQLHQLEHHIYQIAQEPFNINSPKQLSAILFDKMGITPPKKTATGYSTAADVLESLQDASPIINIILEYRTLEKLRSTYIDALPKQVLSLTHRIHCTFNQSMTATGRLSCQDPNLQNIPVRTELGKKIRAAFKPQKPHYSFVSADYSQIELRLLAHLSEDPTLIAAFLAGEDIHAYTASQVFNVPLEQVTPEMRHQSKAVNFGIIYGQQAYGLSKTLGIKPKEAAAFIERYFARYTKIKEFLEHCKASAAETGKATTLTGRQRPIPDMRSTNSILKGQAERLAINTPLQGTAADLIKMAMIQIDHLLQQENSLGMMILQIHDELLFEVADNQVDALSLKIKTIMESTMTLKVPLIVDISIGKNWGEC